tara:strand:- start:4377 stop:6092 length:1716 start_codon:yes stop_codon:yes gene_type:complete
MNSFIFLSYFYFLLLSVLGYGFLFKKIFTHTNKFNPEVSYGYIGFYGLAFITFISMLTNIFLAHNIVHNTILHLSGLFFFFIFYKSTNIKYFKYIFFISLILLPSLLISKSNEDFPYYHLPYTTYLTENKLIFGMGHLNHGYNLLSSLFNFNSTVKLPYIGLYSFHFIYVYFLIFFNFFILNEVFNKNNKDILINTLFVLAFVFFNLSFNRIAEFGTDKAGHLLIVLITIKLLQFFKDTNKNQIYYNILPILPLFVYVISLKAYFSTYILLLLPIFFYKQNFLNLIKKIIFTRIFYFCFFLITLMCTHYFFATGCLIAPISFLCFGESFSWARSIESMNELSIWLEQWSKAGAGPGFRAENLTDYLKGINWVPNWIDRYVFTKVTDQIGILFISILLVFGFLFNFSKQKKYAFNKEIYIFYVAILLVFFIWFFKHPALRYGGYPVTFFIFSIPVVLFFEKFKIKNNFNRNTKVLLILVFLVLNIKNVSRIKNEFDRNDMYKFSNFPYYVIKKIEYKSSTSESGLITYSPKYIENESNFCWDVPSPCIMDPKAIIISKKKSGYFFITGTIHD